MVNGGIQNGAGTKARKRLLLVERSRTLRHVLAKVFRGSEFVCDVVESFGFALQRLQAANGSTRPYHGVVLGWPSSAQPASDEFLELLTLPEYQEVFALILSHDVNPAGRTWAASRANTGYVLWKNFKAIVPTISQPIVKPQQAGDKNDDGADAQPKTQISQIAETYQSTNVLLVDDSPSSRIFFRRLLEAGGYAVETCATVGDALDTLKQRQIDIAILDFYMPDMTGDQLCRRIRADNDIKDVACVVLTSALSDHIVKDCLKAGAVECIFKHESSELFLAKIDAIVRNIHSSQGGANSELLLESILGAVSDCVYGVDREGNITFMNSQAKNFLGYGEKDGVVGTAAHGLLHYAHIDGEPIQAKDCFLQQAYINATTLSPVEMVFWTKDKNPTRVNCRSFPLRIQDREMGSVVTFKEVKEENSFDDQLFWYATHDEPTKLLNRRYFEVQLETELHRIKRAKTHGALIYLQVELSEPDAAEILQNPETLSWSDHHNPQVRKALEQIAKMLLARIRIGDLAAHLGSGHFTVILRDVNTKYLQQIKQGFNEFSRMVQRILDSYSMACRVSTGIAIVDERAKTSSEIITRARYAQQLARARVVLSGQSGTLPENVKPIDSSGGSTRLAGDH